MGKLIYGALQREVTIDDTLLWHLETVTYTRLRRGSPFVLRWIEADGANRSMWIHDNSDLCFEFTPKAREKLNMELLTQMSWAADKGGIQLEHGAHEVSAFSIPIEISDLSDADTERLEGSDPQRHKRGQSRADPDR